MKKGKLLRNIALLLLLAFVVIQFVPVDRSVPETPPNQDFLKSYEMPQEFVTLVKDACYDCHSNEAEYPWYAKVAPVSFWIQGHIDEGREHLNFSIWATYDIQRKLHKLEEMAEEVGEGHMPLNSFTWMHPEARLSDAQRDRLVGWFEALGH